MLPTELTLRTTKDGIRLVSVPVRETESLFTPVHSWKSLTSDEANRNLKEFYDADCLRIKTTIKLSHATDAGFNLFGQRMIGYDMNSNTLNGHFYSPQDPTSMELTADTISPEMETFFIVPVRTAFHRIRIQSAVYKDFDCGTVYVNSERAKLVIKETKAIFASQ